MPEYAKDVVTAVLGASVGLAGLLLVFSGFVFAQADGFPKATTDDAIIDKYRNVGRFGLIPFLLALLVSALTVIWFLHPSCCLYYAAVIGFIVLLVASALYGTIVLGFYL
jgi:hypothetical protein